MVESLLDNVQEAQFTDVSDEQKESLIDKNINKSTPMASDEEIAAIEFEAKKRFLMNPANQANIILKNYCESSDVHISRGKRRELHREFLRNAKKGKYKKMFTEELYGVPLERAQQELSKLNG